MDAKVDTETLISIYHTTRRHIARNVNLSLTEPLKK